MSEKHICTVILLLIGISSLCFSSLPDQETNITSKMTNAPTPDVDYQQILEAQKDDKVLIVDVREQDEINETGKLPGSIHIPSRNPYLWSHIWEMVE